MCGIFHPINFFEFGAGLVGDELWDRWMHRTVQLALNDQERLADGGQASPDLASKLEQLRHSSPPIDSPPTKTVEQRPASSW